MANRLRFARWLLAAAVAIPTLSFASGPPPARRRKKLIASGWDKANTERLLQNLREMEQRPFDGVVVTVEGRVDATKRCPMRRTFTRDKWRRQWFQPCVRNLQACRFRRFTDNFVQVGANPGDVDFFDDAGWREIADHWRIAAWVARQGRLKGLLFDPEPYAPPHAQFKYAAQPQRDRHTFDEYCQKARQRGREVMQAVMTEHPELTILCYFMNIAASKAATQPDPRRVLATQTYGLYPAFLDGWLDAVSPKARLVDGCEWAYRYNRAEQYLEAAVLIKGACQNLVSPANRAKYRAQVQVGFGVYLDAYWNPPTSPWYIDGKGRPRVDRLRTNLQTALRVADEYVWFWGEKFRWWPTPHRRVSPKTWPEALPGCERAIRFARDPVDYARQRLAEREQAGTLVNLALNGDFAAEKATLADGRSAQWKPGRPPVAWSAWQEARSKGSLTWDRQTGAAAGSARAAKVANGCFLQKCTVRPNERYAVSAVRRLKGKGDAWIHVRWQTSDDKWTAEAHDRLLFAEGPRDQWREIFGVVQVPAAAGQLVILLGAGDQPTDADVAWFDDVRLHRLD